MAMSKVTRRVKAGLTAMVFVLSGSFAIGNVCPGAYITVQAEEEQTAEESADETVTPAETETSEESEAETAAEEAETAEGADAETEAETETTADEGTETEEDVQTEQKSVVLTLGGDESSRGLTWYADTDEAGQVQYAKASDMTGGEFPSDYTTVDAVSTAANDEGFYSNQATLSDLEEDTEYVYRVVNGDTVSEVYSFSTGDYDSSFSFAFVGDPQIGAGSTSEDIEGWNETLETIRNEMDVDFLLSAGDQVNTNNNEEQYTGYINDVFSSLASVTTIGNHDSGSAAYSEHFNLPNESTEYGATAAGTDYWFVYNNTLFININSNDLSTAEHKAFMEEAIAANPDVTWKTVIFHHSIYSTASHTDDADIIQRREELSPVLGELDIDVVLMGHDHVYTRTYMMNGTIPDTSDGVQSEVTDPDGVLYLTANSASGSKYYDIKAADAAFSAVMDQSYRRTVTDVEITDTSYTLTTYYADDMSVLDTFTINKTSDEEMPDEDDGSRDDDGDQGDTGDSGSRDDDGDQGDTGDSGSRDDDGDQGNTGDSGSRDDDGDQDDTDSSGNSGRNTPQTGDQTSVVTVIIALAVAGCVAIVIARRKFTV